MAFPTLVERALKMIETEGPLGETELVRALFGNAVGPWPTLVQRVLGEDPRVVRLPDSRYALAEQQLPPAGLIVLATGPKPWKDPIVAIGAARWRGDRLETDEWFVQPNEPSRIPQYLAKYGVTQTALEDGMPLERALEHLLDFVGEAPLAGLDVAVGVARLQFALRALGRPALANQLHELAVADDERPDRPDLVRLAKRSGLPTPERPRPSTLAALAARLARPGRASALREPAGPYVVSALDATGWRHLLDARLLAELPDSPGVYIFRDAADRPLYVGKATSLRGRLSSYLTGNFPLVRNMPGLVEATARVDHEPLPCELAARLREAELIAAESPPYNVQRQVEPRLVRAKLASSAEVRADGRRVPRLCIDESVDAVLTTAAAASAALSEARASWWLARPKVGERPTADEVQNAFKKRAAAFERATRGASLYNALRAEDLTTGLLVGAPERPTRRRKEMDDEEDGWTRERVDEEWRRHRRTVEEREPAWAALLVDGGGLRACVPLDVAPTSPTEVERALASVPLREPSAGLAVLSVLLAALRRGEPGVVAWPRR